MLQASKNKSLLTVFSTRVCQVDAWLGDEYANEDAEKNRAQEAAADVVRRGCTHAVRAAPLALGGLVQLGLEADEVVRSGAGVAQDDLPTLLAHLAVVLVIRLVAVALLVAWDWREQAQADGTQASENVCFCEN